MNEYVFYHWLLLGWLTLAVAIFILLLFVNAPYGRYIRSGWGVRLNNRLGWFIMEATAAILFLFCSLPVIIP